MIKPTRFLPKPGGVLTLLCTLAAGLLRAQTPAPPPHKPLLPLAPAEVMAFLPAAPAGWELKQSRTSSDFLDWLTSEGFREYSHPPASAPGETGGTLTASAAPAPPMITRLRIMDTGYWPSLSGDFDDFKIGKIETGEALMLHEFQAVRTPLGKNGERLRISVKRRFIVQIDALNQPANSVATWARTVDLQRLARIPDSTPDKLPKPITIMTIDELDPRKNSVNKLQWMSDAEIEAANRQAAPR